MNHYSEDFLEDSEKSTLRSCDPTTKHHQKKIKIKTNL